MLQVELASELELLDYLTAFQLSRFAFLPPPDTHAQMAALKRPLQEQSGLSMYAEEIPGTEVTLEDFEIWSFQRLKGSQPRAALKHTHPSPPLIYLSNSFCPRAPPAPFSRPV